MKSSQCPRSQIRRGLIEKSITELIATAIGRRVLKDADPSIIRIEPSPNIDIGDFRIDLRSLFESGGALGNPPYTEISKSIQSLESVEKTVPIPPRIYITMDLKFLYEHVVEDIATSEESHASDHPKKEIVVVSFSDPNTNKPLHIGHLRNNFIGMSLAQMLRNAGYTVRCEAVHSNWGIHICRALVAYQRWGNGISPESSRLKGDHLVGSFYVRFHEETNEGENELENEARKLLLRMGSDDVEAVRLNSLLTGWADEGIRQTYKRIGTEMDVIFYEKNTLPIGLAAIADALEGGVLQRREDGSVWIDLNDQGLGDITLLRSDGTPVVYAQLLGFRIYRNKNYPADRVLSLFGKEWESGAAVMNAILDKLGLGWRQDIEPVLYGMVKSDRGRIRSREGTDLTADHFLDMIRNGIAQRWDSLIEVANYNKESVELLGVALAKYYLLRTGRLKELSCDERILWQQAFPVFRSILRAVEPREAESEIIKTNGDDSQQFLRGLLLHLNSFPSALDVALSVREPAIIVRFLDELADRVDACHRLGLVDRRLATAIRIVGRKALSMLNIPIPASGA